MFFAPGLIFGDSEGVGFCFHVLRSRNRFRRFQGRRVPLSCFSCPYSFSSEPRASGPIFIFCAPGLVFGGIEGVGSRFHVLHSRTLFRRYQERRVPFSRFALPDSFSAVSRASSPVFMFYAPGLVFDGTEGLESCFHVLRSRSFARSYSFSVVPRSSGPVFMFCAPRLIFGATEGVGSYFHVLRSRTCFRRYQGRRLLYMFCAPELIFGGTDGVDSRFYVLRSPACFRKCGGRRVPFSFFTSLYSFSAVPRASGPVLMFCARVLILGSTEGVESHFNVLLSLTHFQCYRRRRVPFSCFALLDSLSAVLWVSAPVFMFGAPELVFGGTEGVRSCSCYAHLNSFSAVPTASAPVFMFCAPGLAFGGTVEVGSRWRCSGLGEN
jgi:hypothetical protein